MNDFQNQPTPAAPAYQLTAEEVRTLKELARQGKSIEQIVKDDAFSRRAWAMARSLIVGTAAVLGALYVIMEFSDNALTWLRGGKGGD